MHDNTASFTDRIKGIDNYKKQVEQNEENLIQLQLSTMYLSGAIGKDKGNESDKDSNEPDDDGLGDPKLNLNIELNKKSNRKKNSEEWLKNIRKTGFRHTNYRVNTLEKGIKTLQNLRNVIKKNREELYITTYTLAGGAGQQQVREDESKVPRKRHRSYTPSSNTHADTAKGSSGLGHGSVKNNLRETNYDLMGTGRGQIANQTVVGPFITNPDGVNLMPAFKQDIH